MRGCRSAASRPNKERDLNCTIHVGHTKEYTPNELHDAFVNAGFAVVEQRTFSPYGFKNKKVASVLPAKLLESEAGRRGEVHFIVGKKVGCHATARPCHKGFINYLDRLCMTTTRCFSRATLCGAESQRRGDQLGTSAPCTSLSRAYTPFVIKNATTILKRRSGHLCIEGL